MEPHVAVVIPAFNERDIIRTSGAALMRVEYPRHKLEIVLVDDGSTDGTGAEADRLGAA